MNEKDVKAEIKRLKTKIKGDMYEDMETLQQSSFTLLYFIFW